MPIKETTFGPKRYLALKKSIPISQIADKQMYEEAGKKLGGYMERHGLSFSGRWSVLYFVWDQAAQRAEIGISFPVAGLDAVDDPELSIVDIPKSKAAADILFGPYDGLSKAHQGLMEYVKKEGYDPAGIPVMAIEEYAVDPMIDPDPRNWVTNIYYLHN